MTMFSPARVQVIDRSVDLLEALADGPRSLKDICAATDLSKGTAFRLLGGLIARGMVIRTTMDNGYALGPAVLKLAQGALSGVGMLATIGRSVLVSLSEETDETVTLHVQSGLDRVILLEIPSRQSIRYSSYSGTVAPIHRGASGVILMAFSTESQRRRTIDLIEATQPDFDRPSLEAKLAKAQECGWAMSIGERVPGAAGISVPVLNESLLMSLSVLGPAMRLSPETMENYLPSLLNAAGYLSKLLNASPNMPELT